MGGARERNAEKARWGALMIASHSSARSWKTWTVSTTVGAPPTMFCMGAKERHSPHSWLCVGAACGFDFGDVAAQQRLLDTRCCDDRLQV